MQEEKNEPHQNPSKVEHSTNPPPPIEPSKLNKSWREKLRERTKAEVEWRALEKRMREDARIAAAVEAKWKRTKIRRRYRTYKTHWIREILKSNPHQKSKNFPIKKNLSREINGYMLDSLDCLTTDGMVFSEMEKLIRSNRYGLKKIWVKARVKNKWIDVERFPILVELNVPAITERINFKRAEQKLRPIKQGVIWNSIRGLEAEGFIRKVGRKRGKKSQLRAIGSYYIRQDRFHYDETGKKIIDSPSIRPVYFWGASQPNVRERLARLEPAK